MLQPSEQQAAYVIGLGLHDALQHAVPGLPRERYPELGQRYRHHYFASQDTLVLTNEPAAQPAPQGGSGDLGRPGVSLKGLFDGTRTADETAGKPNPLMLQQLMREFGTEPERTLMIGDTTHDLQMALNAGTASVGVSFGAHDHATFADLAPLHVAHSTADLARWLAVHA